MIRVILQSFLGLLFASIGFYIVYQFLQIPESIYQWIILLVAGFIPSGLFLLLRVGVSKETVGIKMENPKESNQSVVSTSESGNLIKRNNDLVKEWNKTIEQRDKLKMLEMSSDAKDSE